MKKNYIFVSLALFVLLAFLISCGLFQTEEGKIKRIIYSAKRDFQKENIFRCISYVSLEYTDKYGFDKRGLFYLGKEIFKDYDKIAIRVKKLDIKIQDKNAYADITARVSAVSPERSEYSLYQELFHFIVSFSRKKILGRL